MPRLYVAGWITESKGIATPECPISWGWDYMFSPDGNISGGTNLAFWGGIYTEIKKKKKKEKHSLANC